MIRRRGVRRDALIQTIMPMFGVVAVGGCLFLGTLMRGANRVDSLTAIILAAGALSALLHESDGESDGRRIEVSGSVVVMALAAGLLGPLWAGVAAGITELFVSVRYRQSIRGMLAVNLPACVIPAVGEGALVHVISWPPANVPLFYVAIAVAGLAGLVASYPIAEGLHRVYRPHEAGTGPRAILDALPSTSISLAIALAGVGITLEIGTGGIAFALAAVIAFSYMSHLLGESRHRAEQYASLSWGVLAGLLRSLDIRDERIARHSAAVARFSRDIAAATGMDAAQCELAHAAGLLHDIGRFALSDRVFERGRSLTDEDWEAIQRHPELGADMLRDLGMYGPVAEIVLCHHERIDGLGYPRRLRAEEIPEIAKIIAVAEVYDTLTASDTYRTRQSSFEALTELRRVAGTQLDGRYVEVLSDLLSGEGVEYRHADAVDFDEELGIEQIIKQAGTGR
jgi:putative nucleotidyltransferase with HDIG domain